MTPQPRKHFSKEDTLMLIEAYKQQLVLWHPNHCVNTLYIDRKQAWQRIANALNANVHKVKKKLYTLLGRFWSKQRRGTRNTRWWAQNLTFLLSQYNAKPVLPDVELNKPNVWANEVSENQAIIKMEAHDQPTNIVNNCVEQSPQLLDNNCFDSNFSNAEPENAYLGNQNLTNANSGHQGNVYLDFFDFKKPMLDNLDFNNDLNNADLGSQSVDNANANIIVKVEPPDHQPTDISHYVEQSLKEEPFELLDNNCFSPIFDNAESDNDHLPNQGFDNANSGSLGLDDGNLSNLDLNKSIFDNADVIDNPELIDTDDVEFFQYLHNKLQTYNPQTRRIVVNKLLCLSNYADMGLLE